MIAALIAAARVEHYAGLVKTGAMTEEYALRAAENTLARLTDGDREEAEAFLRAAHNH